MTQDEVIALAREAGIDGELPNVPAAYKSDWFSCTAEELTRFAALVKAKLMERLLAGAVEPVATKTAGGAYDGITLHLGWDDTPSGSKLHTADQLAAAVLREREECAKVCDELANASNLVYAGTAATRCAQAIRARGNT